MGSLGIFANVEGRAVESMAHLAEATDLAEQLDDDWLMAMCLSNVGAIHHQLGEDDKAQDCYAEVLDLARKIGSPRLTGKTLLRLGSLQLDIGRPADASDLLRPAEEFAKRLGDVPLYAAVLGRLGTVEECSGNHEKEAELRRRALAVFSGQTGTESEIRIRNRLVWCNAPQEHLTQVCDQFERAITLSDTDANPTELSRAVGESRASAKAGRRRKPGVGDF
ncbi:tetratricopeptide repeat protein [Streptomyces sp. NPDC050636]|uniref:tetratricopeptide repeat protein n=1 Tax=Streptomyces sp. NPDC050636 TaxID=3154510 RepID=UPI0034419C2C